MTKEIHKPIEESVSFTEEDKEKYRKYFITSISFFVLSIATLYIIFVSENIGVGLMIVNIGVTIIMAVFSLYYYNISKGDAFTERFLVNERGIFKTYKNYTQETEHKEHITFENIKKIIVCNYAAPYQEQKSKKQYYYLGAFILIYHTEGSYFLYVYKADQFHNFIDRFLDKNRPLYRSKKNLENLFLREDIEKLDFSLLPIEAWDGQSNFPSFEDKWDHDPYETYKI